MSAQTVTGIRYFEFPIKWSHIKRGITYGSAKGFIPTLKEFLSNGSQVEDIDRGCELSVCLTPKPEDVEDLRLWCKENSEEYSIVGRYGTICYEDALDYGYCKDVKFVFADRDIALMFKLTFG